MTEDIFEKRFVPAFLEMLLQQRSEWNQPTQSALLTLDGHASHLAGRAIDLLAQHNAVVVAMPSHTTHIFQAADAVVILSLKKAFTDGITNMVPLSVKITLDDICGEYLEDRRLHLLDR